MDFILPVSISLFAVALSTMLLFRVRRLEAVARQLIQRGSVDDPGILPEERE